MKSSFESITFSFSHYLNSIHCFICLLLGIRTGINSHFYLIELILRLLIKHVLSLKPLLPISSISIINLFYSRMWLMLYKYSMLYSFSFTKSIVYCMIVLFWLLHMVVITKKSISFSYRISVMWSIYVRV